MSNDWSRITTYISIFLLCGIFILFFLFIWVMGSSRAACIFMDYTGTEDKTKLLEFIGWVMSGFIATLGVVGLLKRTAALDEQNKLTEKGHIHERFKMATQHLSNKKNVSVRIASYNEFYRLAEITAKMTEEKGLTETIFEILCAHLRETTKSEEYKKYNTKPTGEMQILLDILFKPKNSNRLINLDNDLKNIKSKKERDRLLFDILLNPKNKNSFIFGGSDANLAEAHLQGANLRYANLLRADLRYTNLQDADMLGALINEKTTAWSQGWEKVVKQYEIDGEQKPYVIVIDDKGKIKGRY